jgi:hypothetical protein
MNRLLGSLAVATISLLGCAPAALAPAPAAPAPAPAAMPAEAHDAAPTATPATADAAKDVPATDTAPASAPLGRTPGDFVVYRFSGSFRKAPLTLTEKVVARRGGLLTIDFATRDGAAGEELRVTFDESSPSHSEVVRVARLEGGVEKAATPEAYEALMARTTLAADQNDALVGTEDVTVDVGGTQIAAKRTTYQVRVGKRKATLKTLESATFAWGDVGGELTTAGGKVLYRAEVVDTGHDDGAAKAAAMAQ